MRHTGSQRFLAALSQIALWIWVLLAMVPLGVASIVFFVTANSTLQLSSRPEMRGRVMALYGIVFLGTTPIASRLEGSI